jgi:hypothetical protein
MYILPANHFNLSIHDLTKTDLKDLDARYFKSWLGMPQSGCFLPMHSGHGLDVKSVSHLYKESRSLDTIRALTRGDHTIQTTVSRNGQENLPLLSAPPRLLGPFCPPWNLQSVMLLFFNPLGHP